MLNEEALNEFEELFDKIYPNQINLKSFEKKDTLNPKIWKDGTMRKLVRVRLVNIAKEFIDNLEMGLHIEDIVIVGSIAGYNWSKFSDIDLHIVIDFAKYSNLGNHDTLKELFDMKKNNWNEKHNVLIFGYPVEMYIQDINEFPGSDGVYSVLYNKWNQFPTGNHVPIERELIKALASQYINIIDILADYTEECHSKRACKILKEEVRKIHDEIVNGRRAAIAKDGEYGARNIVFKVLRRTGHLGKLRELKVILNDKINSI